MTLTTSPSPCSPPSPIDAAPAPPVETPPTPDPLGHAWILAQALVVARGEPSQWRQAPVRLSLASAIIDAIMSARVTTSSVDAVVRRYERRFEGGGSATLAASFDEIGTDAWRATIGTNHRTHSSVTAPYKVGVIERAARLLLDEGIDDIDALWSRAGDAALRDAWCALSGQASGASWRHLLLVSGYTEPVVCPLTRRFVRRVLGRAVADGCDLGRLVTATADVLDVAVADADHQMWRAANAPARRHDDHDGAQEVRLDPVEATAPGEALSARN